MSYQPIRTPADLAARLVPGETREDHWLDFKGFDEKPGRPWSDTDECRRDVTQFANASGGSLVIGAVEDNHVLKSFKNVSDSEGTVRWLDEVLNKRLEPVPTIEPVTLRTATGGNVVVVNVPPSIRLIALRSNDLYQFPIRAVDSKRYMTLAEIEARMQDQTRVHRLQLERIDSGAAVGLDATIDRDLGHNDWRVLHVSDDVVVLKKGAIEVPVPLAYIQAVYRAGLQNAEWVIDLDGYLSKHRQRAIVAVTKKMPQGRNEGHYRVRGLADET